jgi:aryl-alcohol dehydrogenase-like predicted oxidoreductase
MHELPIEKRILGKTGWPVSSIGFGGYRVHADNSEHLEALTTAINAGCNIIETSGYYENGNSELLFGRISSHQLHRISKAGYGNSAEDHCISPEFLEKELEKSLKRLNVTKLDGFLLHNPEAQLATGNRDKFTHSLKEAFATLERFARNGLIGFYGISSNAIAEPPASEAHLPLEVFINAAGAESHFAIIEFPLNLLEATPAITPDNSGKTLLQKAAEYNLGVLTNRPLNAFLPTRVFRLASGRAHHGIDTGGNLRARLQQAMNAEAHYPGEEIIPLKEIAWGHIIHRNAKQINDPIIWQDNLNNSIHPALRAAFNKLRSVEKKEINNWLADYEPLLAQLFKAVTTFLEAAAAEESRNMSAALNKICPQLKTSSTLSQKSLRIIRSFPEISSVLIGMRRPTYVTDLLPAAARDANLSVEQAKTTLESLEAFKQSG